MKILIEDLSFSYDGERDILSNLNLAFEGDGPIAVVGHSGTGKSTLLKILSGLLPTNNKNRIKGKVSINGMNPDEFAREGRTAFMFQEPTLLPHLSVYQNVQFPSTLKGIKTDQSSKLLETLGLLKFKDYYPYQLSGGMKCRVALARTFSTMPTLLMLDEPFNSLDIKWKRLLYKELEILQSITNSFIFLVTHDIGEALRLANKIIVLGGSGAVTDTFSLSHTFPRNETFDPLKDTASEYFDIQNVLLKT